jgi:methionyl-tRNA synthetase
MEELQVAKPYYITTAIAYTSKTPHIGNTYEAVLADSIARYKRMTGYDVFFMTGTDEHGQKIQQQAEIEGITPQEHVDKIAGEVREIWDFMNTSYDKFIRTTDADHELIVQKIFKRLFDQGDIYKGSYEGFYCTPCESFYTESQVEEGMCPDCGAPVTKASEEAYFFKLGKYEERLKQHIIDHPDFIQPESRKNEMLNNFINKGLQDLCVSRTSFSWGVPVTFDEKHVVYVWIDALSNYITGLGYNPEGESGELFNKYWPADVHLIGKDILRFHTIYWPIMLMALDVPLPGKIFGHPWLMFGEDKMSKSKGNTIYAKQLVEHFGVDATRYYVLHEMPFAQDGTLTYELMIARVNSDLANILGNLVNRTVAMVNKYFGGLILPPSEIEPIDEELQAVALELKANVDTKMDDLKVADAIDEIWTLLRRSNKYIDETYPWVMAKDESKKARLGTVLYHLLESIRFSAVLLSPFMPETATKILEQINAKATDYASLDAFDGTVVGDKVGIGEVLFARIDEKEKLEAIFAENEAIKTAISDKSGEPKDEVVEEVVEEITFDEFMKVQMKVGEVIACEPVPKTNKLLVSKIKIGDEVRQIVSGIAKYYTPEEMVGKKVVVVTNLKPIKLRGMLSEGMILAASDEAGNLKAVTIDGDIESGSEVR